MICGVTSLTSLVLGQLLIQFIEVANMLSSKKKDLKEKLRALETNQM